MIRSDDDLLTFVRIKSMTRRDHTMNLLTRFHYLRSHLKDNDTHLLCRRLIELNFCARNFQTSVAHDS